MSRVTYSNAAHPSERVTRWAVGVTSAPRTEPTLLRSLESLAGAGWPMPRIFAEPEAEIPPEFTHLSVTRRGVRLGAFPNWLLALAELVMQEPRAEAYLLCQDDVLYAGGLRDYLERRLWPAADVGVVSVYCPSHYSTVDRAAFVGQPAGWKACPTSHHSTSDGGAFRVIDEGWDTWGALAYIFPNPSARALVCDPFVVNHRHHGPADGTRNIDCVVGSWCRRSGLPYYVHVPSLAQHIGETSTIWTSAGANGRRRASDFAESAPFIADR